MLKFFQDKVEKKKGFYFRSIMIESGGLLTQEEFFTSDIVAEGIWKMNAS